GWTYAGANSAEWIVEDNESSLTSSLNPFANYGSVTFSNITTNLSPWYLTPNDGVEIVQNGVALSVPSPIVNSGFTVTYKGP
ncbi:MAG TPA: G1 family glutamic endopeptidase, partial [Acidimicrobiales bacterium]